MKTIVSLVDFSDVTTKVLDYTHVLAKAFEGDVTLLHVVPTGPVVVDFAPPPPPAPGELQAKQRALWLLRENLAAHGIKVTAQVFEGPLVDTILSQLRSINPDAIVMGSHGHGALYNLLVGSVTEEIIKLALWPVFVVPAMPVSPPKQPPPARKPAKTGHLMGTLGGPPAPL